MGCFDGDAANGDVRHAAAWRKSADTWPFFNSTSARSGLRDSQIVAKMRMTRAQVFHEINVVRALTCSPTTGNGVLSTWWLTSTVTT